MKLATLRNGRPDGQLVVVSRDLSRCISAGKVAPSLQAALDAWDDAAPALRRLSEALDAGEIAGQGFDPADALAPLPRAYQWIGGAGYLWHLERVRGLSGERDGLAAQRPLVYQGASDSLAAPTDPVLVPEDGLAVDYEAELAAILGPVPMRPDAGEALAAVRLLGLCNDVSLRRLVADDLANGFGFFHAKPATSFAPVVATPDEFASLWRGGRLGARVHVEVNARPYGRLDAGADMDFSFADMIVAAAQTRTLGCGTILSSGAIANRHDAILPLKRDGVGFGCIAEARTAEKARFDKAVTPFMAAGDRVRIEAFDRDGGSMFGAIDQTVRLAPPRG